MWLGERKNYGSVKCNCGWRFEERNGWARKVDTRVQAEWVIEQHIYYVDYWAKSTYGPNLQKQMVQYNCSRLTVPEVPYTFLRGETG